MCYSYNTNREHASGDLLGKGSSILVKMLNEAKESQVIWPAILWELNVCNRRIQPA
jgi:hypothetical protein